MEWDSISFIGAAVGGFLSFFSPCTLPLLPSLVAFLGEDSEKPKIGKVAAFWLGFTVVFLIMGGIFAGIGSLFFEFRDVLLKASGVFIVLMGLFLIGFGKNSLLQREFRPFLSKHFQGYGGAFFFGMAFTVGWTPCSGPILASILTIAGNSENPTAGLFLLSAYAIGFSAPFWILTLFFDQLFLKIKPLYPYLPLFQKISGILLVVLGIAIFFDQLSPWLLKVAY